MRAEPKQCGGAGRRGRRRGASCGASFGLGHIGEALAHNARLLADAIDRGDKAEADRRLNACDFLVMAMQALSGRARAGSARGTARRTEADFAGHGFFADIKGSLSDLGRRAAGDAGLTPRWRYVVPLLEFLDSQGGEPVAAGTAKNHLDGTMEHTAVDCGFRMSGERMTVKWMYDVDWVKRVLLVAGAVADNGVVGHGAEWRITSLGSSLLKLIKGGDVDAEAWWRENEARARGRGAGGPG